MFGSSKDNDEIPPGTSDILGFVQWVDEVPAEEMDVELAGQTVAVGEAGMFAFNDVDNGQYTLKVIRNEEVIHEHPIVVKGDMADLVVLIGENVFQMSSFEEHPIGEPLALSGSSDIWTVNPKLSGTEATMSVVSTEGRTGNKSVQVITNSGSTNTLRQYGRNLVGGATYRLTAWFKTNSPVTTVGEVPELDDPFYMRLRFYVAGSSSTIAIKDDLETMFVAPESQYVKENGDKFVRIYPVSHDDEWNRLYAEFTVPENSDRLLMELTNSGVWHEGEEGTLWWDDVSLVRID